MAAPADPPLLAAMMAGFDHNRAPAPRAIRTIRHTTLTILVSPPIQFTFVVPAEHPRLTDAAYKRFRENAIAIPTSRLAAIANSAMAIDIFLFLCYRLPQIPLGESELVT
jgi:hypothetical protein